MPNTAQVWTAREDAELRRMVAVGASCAECARALGRTESAVMNRRFKVGARAWLRDPKNRRARVAEYLAAAPGATSAEIARGLGCSLLTVARHRRALGLRTLTRGEWAKAAEETKRRGRAELSPVEKLGPAAAAVLGALAPGPASAAAVADLTGRSVNSVYLVLYRLRETGLAFAEGRRGRGRGKGKGNAGTKWYALAWWLERHAGMVRHVANKVSRRNPHVDPEDVASVVTLAVARCVPSFRPRGVKFSTYALKLGNYDAVEYAISERRRGVRVPSQLRFDGRAVLPTGSLDEMGESSDLGLDRFDCLADRRGEGAPVVDPAFWERAVVGLPDRLAGIVLGHYRDGRTFRELGAEIGVTKERVRQLLRKAEARIREGRQLEEFEGAA